MLCDAPWIGPGDLLGEVSASSDVGASTLKQSIEEAERQAISSVPAENEGKIARAASDLGNSRKILWEKMKRYQIEKQPVVRHFACLG